MYRFYNWLFGWDYIHWTNSAHSGIARLRSDAQGNPFYFMYGMSKYLKPITKPEQVVWLTCLPSKYAPTQENTKTPKEK